MTPTQKDIQRLKELIPQYKGILHNALRGNGSPKERQRLSLKSKSLRSRIDTLLTNIKSRFFNSIILEVTYSTDTGKFRAHVTDVTPQDVREFFGLYEYFTGVKITILEIREIQDRINILPL